LRQKLRDPEAATAEAAELRVAIARQFTIASMNGAILQLYSGALGRKV
jgi:hypothetical protein